MTGDAAKRTFGENFLLELQKAESRGLLFAVVEDTAARFYPQYNLEVQLGKLSDFDSVAVYQNKLARVRIEYNAKAVRDIHQRLVGLTNFGEDNYKYKEKIIRKLNLLINNHPALDEIVYIAMASYIARGYGNAEKFKRELKEHMKDNRPADGVSKMLPISCEADVCSV